MKYSDKLNLYYYNYNLFIDVLINYLATKKFASTTIFVLLTTIFVLLFFKTEKAYSAKFKNYY